MSRTTPLVHFTPIKCERNQYLDFMNNLKKCFNNFKVLQPGILWHHDILIIGDTTVPKEEMEEFGWKLCASLEAIGIEVKQFYLSVVKNMGEKEEMLEFIQLFPNVQYFLLVGSDNSYHCVSKWLKLKTGIRGNYKDYRKLLPLCDWLPIALEINKQCRGLNYPCPPLFPRDTAFIHFKICKWQISCGTNATKFLNPDVMLPGCLTGECNYVEKLEHLCLKLTGKLDRKYFQKTIITFENCLAHTSSSKIAMELYEVAAKFLTWTMIGVAEICLNPTGVKSCISMIYDDGMGSAEVLKNLKLCRNCSEIRLFEGEETDLPEQIKKSNDHFSNLTAHFKTFDFPLKYQATEEDADDEMLNVEYPRIKHRNQVLQDIDDFSIDESERWCEQKRRRKR